MTSLEEGLGLPCDFYLMSACCWFSFEVELVKCLIMSQSNTSIVLQSMSWLQERKKMCLVVLIMEYYSSGDIQTWKLANPTIPPHCNLTLITTTAYWNTWTVSVTVKFYLANNNNKELKEVSEQILLKCRGPSRWRILVSWLKLFTQNGSRVYVTDSQVDAKNNNKKKQH